MDLSVEKGYTTPIRPFKGAVHVVPASWSRFKEAYVDFTRWSCKWIMVTLLVVSRKDTKHQNSDTINTRY